MTIDSCTFTTNTAGTNGGGVWSYSRSLGTAHFSITNCAFNGNIAVNGAAVHAHSLNAGSLIATTIDRCTFMGNTTSGYGAICTYGQSNSSASTSVTGCSFVGNSAATGGGLSNVAIAGSLATTDVSRCWFGGNTAKGGGGMNYSTSVGSQATLNVANCISHDTITLRFRFGEPSDNLGTYDELFGWRTV